MPLTFFCYFPNFRGEGESNNREKFQKLFLNPSLSKVLELVILSTQILSYIFNIWLERKKIFIFCCSHFYPISPSNSNSNIHPFSEVESDPASPKAENIRLRPDKYSFQKQKTSSNIFHKNKALGLSYEKNSEKPRFVFRAPPPFVWSNLKKKVCI